MARPKRDGLLYFSFDTDFFYADKRIKRLQAKFGNDGLIFYIYLLTEIYRNGYYIRWDEESAEDAAADLHLKEGFIEQVLTFLRDRSLLITSKLVTGDTIITSPGIQKRYQEAVKERGKKRQIEVNSEIWLLSEKETASYIKVTHNDSFSEKNPSKSEKNQSKSEKNPIKESKVNKSKVNNNTQRAERIEEFISAYPKKCHRYLTETAYLALISDGVETEDNLIACAKNYAEWCQIMGREGDHIKNPENFLKEFIFEEYLPGRYKRPETKPKKGNQFCHIDQHNYDFDAIEKALMERRNEE